jgi:hypothetical protein
MRRAKKIKWKIVKNTLDILLWAIYPKNDKDFSRSRV